MIVGEKERVKELMKTSKMENRCLGGEASSLKQKQKEKDAERQTNGLIKRHIIK